ncbi:hypothetical protein BDP27DRAFT_1313440 [Rhodocollybia butyracea]|uniref:Uncharacterized protein n=1 Tax=Rhodocollybia butyracea TaxID=206335 RepID=A0A9P5UER9_9AGAR|nr:hypothetical protein BDP27DRAFT_1313440 [Rhodocollybia butyracea]
MQWCLDEQEKRRAAKERQGLAQSHLHPEPQHHYSGMHKYGDPADFGVGGRSRMPLIHLAQQQQQQMLEVQERQTQLEYQQQMIRDMPLQQIVLQEASEEDIAYEDIDSSRRLSTISEHTERTELSPYWPRHEFLPPRASSSITESSYGNLIDAGYLVNPARLPLDPNLIPVSPSGSAVHRLSIYEPAPSVASSGSYIPSTPPHPPSEPVPSLDKIPEIPDSQSSVPPPVPPKSAKSSAVKQPSSSIPSNQAVKQSKLAQLASSRGSTRTKSSASLGTEAVGSIKTYPALRPESHYPPSFVSSSSSSSSASTALPIPPVGQPRISKVSSSTEPTDPPAGLPSNGTARDVSSSFPSSTSLDVRKAVEAAMQLEALDRELAASRQAKRTPTEKKTPTEPSKSSSRPAAPSPTTSGAPPNNTQSARAPSKLALLAQAKAQKADMQKAISKTRKPALNQLPPEHTEYLTPIANGSSVTTAITTSYQTLYSLTDPTRPHVTEAPFVVPLPAQKYISSSTANPSPTVTKPPSKLAMKIKKAQEKSVTPSQTTAPEEEPPVISVPPIFLPKSTGSSASPSAFASVLVDDDLMINSPQVNAGTSQRSRKGKEKATSELEGRSSTNGSNGSGMERQYSSHRQKRIAPTLGTPTSASSFAFDGPSPDDIVFNARRGTSLATPKDRKDAPTKKSSSRA